ncbi:winged helix-turn-helix domain-containing protein [Sediminitomix flava]|uniref:Molybdate transport system regulatory protein n=1 Tax=Sediminitomix flava TaxID=379075 RepID=A0A315ZFJ1_SEDFL|nr:LysR family transcriptional regulator [Sediminitomix flava]PWJ44335.1 molybdate transport system regulatory protein [Sediminitomix flava]
MRKIKGRFWIEENGQTLLGEGRVRLLEALLECGSISASAKKLGISYRKAWRLIDELNKAAGEGVVLKSSGGKGGGGTVVTEKGTKLIKEYRELQVRFYNFLDGELANIEENLKS